MNSKRIMRKNMDKIQRAILDNSGTTCDYCTNPRMLKMKERENTKFMVLNYYHDGCPFDFTLELHKIKASTENHKLSIAHAEKNNLEADAINALPDLISDLRFIKEMLKGRLNILVIVEKDHDGQIDCSDIDMSTVTGGND